MPCAFARPAPERAKRSALLFDDYVAEDGWDSAAVKNTMPDWRQLGGGPSIVWGRSGFFLRRHAGVNVDLKIGSRPAPNNERVEAAMALFRAEIERELEMDWVKAHALAADGRAQIACGEYIEFKDGAALDVYFKAAIQRMKDGRTA